MQGPARRASRTPDSLPGLATLTLDRRRFLVLLGGAAALATVRPPLAWARRLARLEPTLQPWALPDSLPGEPIEAARALIGAAILAPSYMNAQPWRFEADGGQLRMTLDRARTLPGSDPDQRLTQMSLGAALENLLVAARAWGQQPAVQYLPWGPTPRAGAPLVAASVSWAPGEQRRDRALFLALAERRSNAHHYDGRAITIQNRSQLLAQIPEELHLHWIEDRGEIRKVASIVRQAVLATTKDDRAQGERRAWIRGSDEEARRRGDGVTPERLGLTGPFAWIAAWGLDPRSRMNGWGAGSLSHDVEDLVRSSGALALLTLPRRQEASWILAGQAYERLALKATSLGLAQQPLSAPIESERHRAALLRRFDATGEEPLLLVRLGHARSPSATPRRAVALVSTYRNS